LVLLHAFARVTVADFLRADFLGGNLPDLFAERFHGIFLLCETIGIAMFS
jgi:hypothetical protein